MLKSCTYSLIGLHLLILLHIANTFVLLTANVEDVKKLARKFVSESLAEKIAEFIAKATEQIATNVSEENNAQEESHQVSEENNMYNVGRQGESGAQDALKSREDLLQEKPDEPVEDAPVSYEATTKAELENFDNDIKKEPEFPRLEGPSRYAPIEPHTVKQYAYPLKEKKPSKISEEDEKYEKENKQNKYLEDNFVNLPITTPEVFVAPIKPRKIKAKGRPYRLLSHVNSNEDNDLTLDFPRNNDTIDAIFGSALFQNRAVSDLTTRKAVFEFDQYENKNYPKSNFVATSGPVALPVVTEAVDKWWEKDLPESAKRRSWFE